MIKVKYSFEDWCNDNNKQSLLKRWDYQLNHVAPNEVACMSSKKYYFKCLDNLLHKSEPVNIANISNRGVQVLCKQCCSFGQWCVDNHKLDYLKMWDTVLNGCTPFDVAAKSNKQFYFKCPNGLHGSRKQVLTVITRDPNCDSIVCVQCNSFEQWCLDNNHQDYLDLWDYELNDKKPCEIAKTSNTSYYFKCPNNLHQSEKKRLGNVVFQGFACSSCKSFGQYLLDTFGEQGINIYWSEKNKISPFSISFSSSKKVVMKCFTNTKHGEYSITCANFVNGNRCPVCVGKRVIRGVNDISTTHPHLVKLFTSIKDSYSLSAGSSQKVSITCPDCKSLDTISCNNLTNSGFSCKFCGDGFSTPHKVMLNVLCNLDTSKLQQEYSPSWAIDCSGSQRKYDFFFELNNISYIIEMDGGFHYKDNAINGQTKEESETIDAFKDKVAYENGIKLYRINCNYPDQSSRLEFIKSNIIKTLSNEFDLSSIDWNTVFVLAEKSSIIAAVEMWNSGDFKTTTEIGECLKLNRHTVRNYLAIGSKLGLCKYDGKKNALSNLTDGSKFRKAIAVYDLSNNYIKTFDSLLQLKESSVDEFGIVLYQRFVTDVCMGRKKAYKGYMFRYADKEE